jgi:hypothetical protein
MWMVIGTVGISGTDVGERLRKISKLMGDSVVATVCVTKSGRIAIKNVKRMSCEEDCIDYIDDNFSMPVTHRQIQESPDTFGEWSEMDKSNLKKYCCNDYSQKN